MAFLESGLHFEIKRLNLGFWILDFIFLYAFMHPMCSVCDALQYTRTFICDGGITLAWNIWLAWTVFFLFEFGDCFSL
jgi:hypothetical protein